MAAIEASSAYEFPPDLPAKRKLLFDLADEPISISEAEYQLLMPYVDNVWSLMRRAGSADYYRCRRWRGASTEQYAGLGKRSKPSQVKIACPMTMIAHHTADERVVLSRGKGAAVHRDTLEEADRLKVPSVFRELAGAEDPAEAETATANQAKQELLI